MSSKNEKVDVFPLGWQNYRDTKLQAKRGEGEKQALPGTKE